MDGSFLLSLGYRLRQDVRFLFFYTSVSTTLFTNVSYDCSHIPIIASVSEHQPTAWPSFFMDLHFLIFLFPVGVILCFKELRDEHLFIIIYAVMASYFAGVMVRLMLTLTPVVCVAAAIALSSLMETYIDPEEPDADEEVTAVDAAPTKKDSKEKKKTNWREKKGVYGMDTRFAVIFNAVGMLLFFVFHCTWVTAGAYSSPSVVLASQNPDGSQHIIDDFREAYYWLRQNTPETAVVMSWWDYGYQIAGMADRPTMVDNNTWNNTHIATVGKAMSSSEEVAYPILRKHDVDYVLVIFGGLLGYSGDDINKFLWMVRIAQGIWPDEIQEPNYFTPQGEYKIDAQASQTMKDSLMYKMSYYRSVCSGQHSVLCACVCLTSLSGMRSCMAVSRRWTACADNNYRRKVPRSMSSV